MGIAQPVRRPWGGRWTAVYSLWTYFHRLLHVLGIAAVDAEELALLSAPLVRIRSLRPRKNPIVLAHHPDPLHPDEPLGWIQPSEAPLENTLFFLHFDSSDPQHPDRARIATASPSRNSPRAWLIIDPKTGVVNLTACEIAASVFHLQPATSLHPAAVTLECTCTSGQYLSVHSDTKRARISSNDITPAEMFLITNVPIPPTLNIKSPHQIPNDYTMALAYQSTRSSPVRIQSTALGWFLSSKPAAPLASASQNDSGWDGFTIEYDSFTRSARVRDSRGLYIGFDSFFESFAACTDVAHDSSTVDSEYSLLPRPRAERFILETIGDDDRVVLRSRKGYLSVRRGGKVVLSKDTIPRRREQFYLHLALPSMMDQSTPRLRLRHSPGGARQIEASVLVPASADIGYQVLCDYNGFHEFLTDASESRILDRTSPTEFTVLMVQCHTFLMLTIPMSMVLNVIETPENRKVAMDLNRGLGIKEYKGVWHAVEKPDGRCLLKCSLLASTSVPSPGFLMDGLMSHATHTTMVQLRAECIRRSALESNLPTTSNQPRRNRSLKQAATR